MQDLVSIDTNELKEAALSMTTHKEELLKIYETMIKPILEISKECIDVSGVDFDEIDAVFKEIFETAGYNIANLSYALTNKIIPNYENMHNNIG